jgi:hypothetical protein
VDDCVGSRERRDGRGRVGDVRAPVGRREVDPDRLVAVCRQPAADGRADEPRRAGHRHGHA